MAFRLKSIWDPERVVPQEVLEGLKHYKYASIDKSILSRLFLARYWSYCATWAPRWMAPNLITLIGFCLVLLNIPITLYFSPDLSTPGPLWMYWSAALGIWFYSVMDNIDGKQARRTGMSSPLGELFDQ
jgi:ethanolaminephosphotransferase